MTKFLFPGSPKHLLAKLREFSMKKHHIVSGTLVLAMFTPCAAADFFSDLVFVPSVGIGFKTLSLDEDFTNHSNSNAFDVEGEQRCNMGTQDLIDLFHKNHSELDDDALLLS